MKVISSLFGMEPQGDVHSQNASFWRAHKSAEVRADKKEQSQKSLCKQTSGASCINVVYAQKLCVRQVSRSESLTFGFTNDELNMGMCAASRSFMAGVRTFFVRVCFISIGDS